MATEDRGFASMDKDKQREIASKGGKASGGTNQSSTTNSKASGAAGKTEAAKRGGEHSHRSSSN